jgi:hypothetical protein
MLGRETREEMRGEDRHVLGSLAQGRQAQGDDADPPVEVLAEASGGDRRPEVPFVAATTRTSAVRVRVSPRRSKARSWRTRRSFSWRSSGARADLVEEEGAAVRRLELPGAVARRPGERAARVPEELALEQRGREAPQLTSTKGAAGSSPRPAPKPDGSPWRGASSPCRSRPRRARSRASARSTRELEDAPRGRIAGHEAAEPLAPLEIVLQARVFARERALVESASDREEELLLVDRLREAVEGSRPERADFVLDRAERGDEDELGRVGRPRGDARAARLAEQARSQTTRSYPGSRSARSRAVPPRQAALR